MTQSRVNVVQPAKQLKQTSFVNKRLASLGIEVMDFSHLRGLTTEQALCLPERVDFHMLLLVTGGTGMHTVDFVDWPLLPESLLYVRPGQVQQWHVAAPYNAEILLIDPVALRFANGLEPGLERLGNWPACMRLPRELECITLAGLGELKAEILQYDNRVVTRALIRHLLLALLLRLERWRVSQAEAPVVGISRQNTHCQFLQLLEADFRTEHSVHYYARRLGYSPSTLNRACAKAEGRPSKHVIDRRVALEAQRLLAHSPSNVAEIGHGLGFSETGNFIKFFARVVGRSPTEFRETWQSRFQTT